MRVRRGWVLALPVVAVLLIAAAVKLAPHSPVSDDGPGKSGGGRDTMGTIVGTVTTPDGAPVPEAHVRVDAVGEAPPVPELGVLTGPAGRYEWRLHPGDYRVTVTVSGVGTATGQARVTAGAAVPLDLTLS